MPFQAQVNELKKRQHYCYNPFQHHEKKQYKTLGVVTSRQVAIYPSKLMAGAKLCDSCRKRITGLPSEIGLCDEENSATCNTGSDSPGSSRSQDICNDKGDENYQCQEEEFSVFDKSLSLLGESPLDKRKLLNLKSYIPEKKKKLKILVKRKLDLLSPNSDAFAIDTSEDNEYEATKKNFSMHVLMKLLKWYRISINQDKYKYRISINICCSME